MAFIPSTTFFLHLLIRYSLWIGTILFHVIKCIIRVEIFKNTINKYFIKIASTKSEEKKGRREEKEIIQIYI
jgi:multisubunit Na+/H+ antiporter MnhC subunit